MSKGGVYMIRCKADRKVYIGKAADIHRRWSQHQCLLRQGLHQNVHLQRAWDLYGAQDFEFLVLQTETDPVQRSLLEIEYIKQHQALNPMYGFNFKDPSQTPQAVPEEPPSAHVVLPPLQVSHPQAKRQPSSQVSGETRRKMSLSRKGQPKSEETKLRMAAAWDSRRAQSAFSWEHAQAIRKLSLESPYNKHGGLSKLAQHLGLSYMRVYKVVTGLCWNETESRPYHPTKQGLEILTGPMFAGKTGRLVTLLRAAAKKGLTVACFRPLLDTRNSVRLVASHDGKKMPAQTVATALDILRYVETAGVQVVGIDEIQFFDTAIVDVCRTLGDRGIRVIGAGLNQDSTGTPFGSMPQLLSLADEVAVLTAICTECGGYATKTQRLVSSGSLVDVGAADKYASRCRAHWTPGR